MNETMGLFCTAVASDLLGLARLHDREIDDDHFAALREARYPSSLAFRLETPQAATAAEWLTAALQPPFDARYADELAADYAAIYLTHGIGAAPCESVWLDEDGLAMQGPMFAVRERYAAFGLRAPDWRMRPDDHLVHQLQFVAELCARADRDALAEAADFADDHTLRWLPAFAERVAQRAATPFYAGLALLTAAYLEELRDVLAEILDRRRPSAEEIERRNRAVVEVALPMPSSYVPGATPSW